MFCTRCGEKIPNGSKVCPSCRHSLEAQLQPEPELAKESERYQIIGKVGKGGMGEVYKAKDLRLNRIVALKRLSPAIQKDYISIQRFMREAKSIASLNHPNIVQVYDIGKDKQGYYISMEFIEGKSLKEKLIQNGSLKLEETIIFILAIADALRFAHEKGIIHRDIKPSNIFLTKEGNIKIMDFGLVRTKGIRKEEITTSTLAMGTPDYMSPEQKKDAHSVDERTDIYSLGLVFCELLLGKLPRIIQTEHLPPIIHRTINKALEEDLNRRYGNISEMTNDLKELKQTLDFTPEMIKTPRMSKRKIWKDKRLWVIPLATLVVIALGILVWRFYWGEIFFISADLPPDSPRLNGIIYRADNIGESAVIINRESLKVGEMIDGYRVLKIRKNDVILGRQGKRYILSFQQTQTRKEDK